jgi:hypothetical protein
MLILQGKKNFDRTDSGTFIEADQMIDDSLISLSEHLLKPGLMVIKFCSIEGVMNR